jgi:hypothetical protein
VQELLPVEAHLSLLELLDEVLEEVALLFGDLGEGVGRREVNEGAEEGLRPRGPVSAAGKDAPAPESPL